MWTACFHSDWRQPFWRKYGQYSCLYSWLLQNTQQGECLYDFILFNVLTTVQVSWFTSDNNSNNDTAMRELAKSMNTETNQWDPVKHCIWYVTCHQTIINWWATHDCLLRCMEHSVHLAAGHFIMTVLPTSSCCTQTTPLYGTNHGITQQGLNALPQDVVHNI